MRLKDLRKLSLVLTFPTDQLTVFLKEEYLTAASTTLLAELRGLTKAGLASASGVSVASICSYDAGRNQPSRKNLAALLNGTSLTPRDWSAREKIVHPKSWLGSWLSGPALTGVTPVGQMAPLDEVPVEKIEPPPVEIPTAAPQEPTCPFPHVKVEEPMTPEALAEFDDEWASI